jgi:hypothetical protein
MFGKGGRKGRFEVMKTAHMVGVDVMERKCKREYLMRPMFPFAVGRV